MAPRSVMQTDTYQYLQLPQKFHATRGYFFSTQLVQQYRYILYHACYRHGHDGHDDTSYGSTAPSWKEL